MNENRKSLLKTLKEVESQIQYTEFSCTKTGEVDPLYRELCLIIAEMYIIPPDRLIRIRGNDIEVAIVQEVYQQLRHDHIELVADNFKKQTHIIRKKTAYLQTALYNVIFEIDAHYTNLVKHDMNN